MPVVVRQSWWRKGCRLATTRRNQCVFLTAEKRCRIHELYGEAAKPLLCRLFPFQLTPLDGYANATLRRHCPAAAADLGRTMEEHLPAVRELAEKRASDPQPSLPPPNALPDATPAGQPTMPPGATVDVWVATDGQYLVALEEGGLVSSTGPMGVKLELTNINDPSLRVKAPS